jgi:hypothetical protein
VAGSSVVEFMHGAPLPAGGPTCSAAHGPYYAQRRADLLGACGSLCAGATATDGGGYDGDDEGGDGEGGAEADTASGDGSGGGKGARLTAASGLLSGLAKAVDCGLLWGGARETESPVGGCSRQEYELHELRVHLG